MTNPDNTEPPIIIMIVEVLNGTPINWMIVTAIITVIIVVNTDQLNDVFAFIIS